MVQVDAVAHEHRLAGQVGVVGAGGSACGHQRQPVAGVGPNGGDHDLGAGGHGLQRRRQRRVGGQDRPGLRGFAQGFANGEHPLRRPAGQRDPGISPGPGQVFGGQLADEAGRPVQHDVEFTRRSGHGFDATPGCASRRKSSQIRPDLGAFASFRGGQPRRPQTGQARIPCERGTFSATRICSSRLALAADPEPPLARQVPAVNCRPP
ncbi:Uncharacterised protein [Mycobacterium tuberculosis]|nr:Uncharacterised protein [Mycobacterium tuberculosis]CFS21992.1 Uncharacterised protein [Mycobacterium tuberculosis]COW00204.1 Uncharacterised protein [Mycobacterium tuberculosis]